MTKPVKDIANQSEPKMLVEGDSIESHCYHEITLKEHYMHIKFIALLFVLGIFSGVYLDAPLDWMLVVIGGFVFMQAIWWKRFKDEQKLQNIHIYEDGLKQSGEGEELYAWSDLDAIKHLKPFDHRDKKPGFKLQFSNGEEIYVQQRISGYEKLYARLRAMNIPGAEQELKLYFPMDQYGRALSPAPKIKIAVPAQEVEIME